MVLTAVQWCAIIIVMIFYDYIVPYYFVFVKHVVKSFDLFIKFHKIEQSKLEKEAFIAKKN